MYYIINRATGAIWHKTTDTDELTLFKSSEFEVVIY